MQTIVHPFTILSGFNALCSLATNFFPYALVAATTISTLCYLSPYVNWHCILCHAFIPVTFPGSVMICALWVPIWLCSCSIFSVLFCLHSCSFSSSSWLFFFLMASELFKGSNLVFLCPCWRWQWQRDFWAGTTGIIIFPWCGDGSTAGAAVGFWLAFNSNLLLTATRILHLTHRFLDLVLVVS